LWLNVLSIRKPQNSEEELGERTEEGKGGPSAGAGGSNEPDQGLPAGTAVSQGKCVLQASGSAG